MPAATTKLWGMKRSTLGRGVAEQGRATQQHGAVAPVQAEREAARTIIYCPALLVNTPLPRCQEIYSMPFGASSLLLAKLVQKNPQTPS